MAAAPSPMSAMPRSAASPRAGRAARCRPPPPRGALRPPPRLCRSDPRSLRPPARSPASRIRSTHGGVRPWWAHGSMVTKIVPLACRLARGLERDRLRVRPSGRLADPLADHRTVSARRRRRRPSGSGSRGRRARPRARARARGSRRCGCEPCVRLGRVGGREHRAARDEERGAGVAQRAHVRPPPRPRRPGSARRRAPRGPRSGRTPPA